MEDNQIKAFEGLKDVGQAETIFSMDKLNC